MGALVVKRLQKHDKLKPGDTPDTPQTLTEGPSRGMGLLIYNRNNVQGVMGGMGRLSTVTA